MTDPLALLAAAALGAYFGGNVLVLVAFWVTGTEGFGSRAAWRKAMAVSLFFGTVQWLLVARDEAAP